MEITVSDKHLVELKERVEKLAKSARKKANASNLLTIKK